MGKIYSFAEGISTVVVAGVLHMVLDAPRRRNALRDDAVMITVGGFNVAPAEVEHALREHPSIRDGAVIGVPDVRLGEVGDAFVMRSSGAELDTADLVAWSRERMANFKVPRLPVAAWINQPSQEALIQTA